MERTIVEKMSPTKVSELSLVSGRRWRKKYKLKLTFKEKMLVLMRNTAFMFLLAATFFRFAGGYMLGFWARKYFSLIYPDSVNAYALSYFLILVFGSVPSELIGGIITDRCEESYPRIKGHLSAGGAFIASIFVYLTFQVKTTFAIQMVFYYFVYLFGEVFFGPSYAQINMLVQS